MSEDMKCHVCRKSFVEGDMVVPAKFERVMAGEKSGRLGYYPANTHPDGEADYIHATHSCIEGYFNPSEGYMYDFLRTKVEEQIRQEIYEEEMERREYESDIPVLGEEEEPPYCLWCKKEDTVWVQFQRDLNINFCRECNKLWDQDENELIFDPQRGYIVVE